MAVYTTVEDDEVGELAKSYDLGEIVAFKGIAEGVENSNFLLQTDTASYILTLYERRVQASDLPFFLELMIHLADNGIDCPVPLANKDGDTATVVAGKPAAIVSFLPGISIHRPHNEHCIQLGTALASLHLAGQSFNRSRPNDQSIASWRSLISASSDRANEIQKGLDADLEEELEYLEVNWPEGLPTGIIHGDLFPDNVFFVGGKLSGLIDFYFACTDFLAFDIAICLNAWCFEFDGSFNVTKARGLLAAYQAVRPLEQAELDSLQTLCRAASIRFLSTRLYDWLNQFDGALVKPKDPMEYIKILRFHQGVSGVSAYGL